MADDGPTDSDDVAVVAVIVFVFVVGTNSNTVFSAPTCAPADATQLPLKHLTSPSSLVRVMEAVTLPPGLPMDARINSRNNFSLSPSMFNWLCRSTVYGVIRGKIHLKNMAIRYKIIGFKIQK